jgi:hypothetical protein
MRTTIRIGMAAALVALPAAGWAQRCGENGRRVPDLGYEAIWCSHCKMVYDDNGPKEYDFASEPTIGRITSVGEGKLRDRDVLVAVDGTLITTDEGAQRLVRVRRGDAVRLTVRRDGRTRDVEIRAGERCMEAPRAPRAPVPPTPPRPHATPRPPTPPRPHAAPRPSDPPRAPRPGTPPRPPTPAPAPRAPHAPTPPTPPAPPVFLPTGWFGFGISCDNCGWRGGNGQSGSFYFGEAPEVESVEPGSPADRAGLRRGDRLTHVDGMALDSDPGARRFRSIRPGETVSWTYQRGSRTASARIKAERRPDARAGAAPRAPGAAQRLRFSGAVGDTEVEVRGAPVTVSRDERTGELIIRSSDLTVRVKPEP